MHPSLTLASLLPGMVSVRERTQQGIGRIFSSLNQGSVLAAPLFNRKNVSPSCSATVIVYLPNPLVAKSGHAQQFSPS